MLLGPDRFRLFYLAFVALLPIAVVVPGYLLLLLYPLWNNRKNGPFQVVTYQLVYALGMWSEILHLPVTTGQRKTTSS
jgi:hypothetical protein